MRRIIGHNLNFLLVKVIEDHGEDFDEHNVATAFHQLAKSDSNKGNQDVHEHETFLKLVGKFCPLLVPHFCAKQECFSSVLYTMERA